MSPQPTSPPIVDCLILGGGPAGLSTALGLARQTRTCVLFDSSSYRNAKDHRSPAVFRAIARKELMGRYDIVQFADVAATKVWKVENIGDGKTGFEVTSSNGMIWREGRWYLPRVYHCLFFRGFEERVAPSVGVLAIDATAVPGMAEHLARLAHNLAETVTIYTSGNEALTKELEGKVGRDKWCTIDPGPILRLTFISGILVVVELKDGTSVEQGFLVHMCKNLPNFGFEHNLNLELSTTGSELKISPPFNESTEKGVFAAGDASSMMKSVMLAQGSGSITAVGIATSLVFDEKA